MQAARSIHAGNHTNGLTRARSIAQPNSATIGLPAATASNINARVPMPDGATPSIHAPGSDPTNHSPCSSPEYRVATSEIVAHAEGRNQTKKIRRREQLDAA